MFKKLLVGLKLNPNARVSLAGSEPIRFWNTEKAELMFRNGKKQNSKGTSVLFNM